VGFRIDLVFRCDVMAFHHSHCQTPYTSTCLTTASPSLARNVADHVRTVGFAVNMGKNCFLCDTSIMLYR
jgi:hypothetical protein